MYCGIYGRALTRMCSTSSASQRSIGMSKILEALLLMEVYGDRQSRRRRWRRPRSEFSTGHIWTENWNYLEFQRCADESSQPIRENWCTDEIYGIKTLLYTSIYTHVLGAHFISSCVRQPCSICVRQGITITDIFQTKKYFHESRNSMQCELKWYAVWCHDDTKDAKRCNNDSNEIDV